MAKPDKPESIEGALDAIRKGGNFVATLARMRFQEAIDAIEMGDFEMAHSRAHEAMGKLHALHGAQQSLGAFTEDVWVLRAGQLQDGQKLYGMGTVASVLPDPNDDDVVNVSMEDGSSTRFYRDQELMVVTTPE